MPKNFCLHHLKYIKHNFIKFKKDEEIFLKFCFSRVKKSHTKKVLIVIIFYNLM